MEKNKFAYPIDLAREVYNFFYLNGTNLKVTVEDLESLFEVAYFASLKTEELQPIRVRLTYINKNIPDFNPPKRIMKNRWSYIRFKDDVELTISNLVKIAKAADPEVTALAVDFINGKWIIWGMIDQEDSYHNFILNESSTGPERPGVFYVNIEELAELVVYRGYKQIASLKKSVLINNQIDVFKAGIVIEKLQEYIYEYIRKVEDRTDDEIYGSRESFNSILKQKWISIICRILINIKEYRHGGAILIDNNILKEDLNIKYNILYERLGKQMLEYGESLIKLNYLEDRIFDQIMGNSRAGISNLLINKKDCTVIDVKEYENSISGAIKYISSLSCVDGLVLMNSKFEVNGFGVEILCNEKPPKIYIANDAKGEFLKEVHYEHFGTRHRSMMRYCYKKPNSIGFVISQDGDIRVILNKDNNIIIWNNIKILNNNH
ncbi:MAG: putative sensor domain DACNV-containing protein [Romboutsia sp.]|uniref:putative sensor domain DACNV-containing protein n=1 Tax=Romboutsia sp. TaxID=1965302 RepID=UPI003F4195E3